MKLIARRDFIKLTILGVPTLVACAKSDSLSSTLTAFENNPKTASSVGNFAFIQVSDTHVDPVFNMPESLEGLRSYATVKTLPTVGSLKPTQDSEASLEPEFFIHTGDMGEFGFAGVTQQVIDRYFEGYSKPKYWIMGNHDNTWVTQTQWFHDEFGGVSYTFDREGVRFIGLNSATFQEPLPSFSEETVLFLRETLSNTPKNMPLVLFWHHPFSGDYFASDYDKERILDELRDHHVCVVLNGHYHSAKHEIMNGGIDCCVATATFSKDKVIIDGFSMVDIQEGKLRVIDVRSADLTTGKILLDKDITTVNSYPKVTIEEPSFRSVVKQNTLVAKSSIDLKKAPARSFYLNGKEISATYDGTNEPNGSHYMRAEYKTEESEQFQRSTSFHWERPHPYSPQAKWQAELGAASVSTPLFHDGLVVIGDNNGNFTAFDADTGKKRWAHNFQLEILRQAAVYKGEFFVGTGAGQIARISNRSKQATALPITTNAVFCPLVIEDGILYYGNQSAELVAFDLEKNQTAWVNKDAQFSIESRPVVSGNEILFTAWDGYLYCLNRENGVLNWRTPGPRNLARERDGGSTTRYYAPADVSPVVAGDRIFLCDRGYNAAIYTRAGEFVADFDDDVSALTASADGSRLFLRRWKKPFAAVDLAGNPLWESKIVLGRLPVEPTLAGNLVLATDNTGTLFAFDQETGAARWRYKITPELFVLGRVEVDPAIETAFAVGMDGVLKAIDLNSLQPM